ncbi:MAG: hypothetical protein IPL86_19200 [Flavobacteriales bacterium]|nr:hypothetical protein [Flavobacteriales bacterium]
MKKQRRQTDAQIDAVLDEYLEPLLEMHDDESIRIARYLALKLSVLQVAIEKVHADVAQLAACFERIEKRLS